MKFKSTFACLAIAAGTAVLGLAHGQATVPPAASATPPAASGAMPASADAMSEGEVRKIDKENRKITLRHGEIRNLEMPGMTMVFQVKDASLLESLKPGDKVTFKAEKANGALVVTELMLAK